MHMGAVSRPRIDRHIGKVLAHGLGDPERCLDIVDGQHESACLLSFGCAQDVNPSGVAVIDPAAEALHEIHLLDVRIECGEGNLAAPQYARHDLPELPKPAMMTWSSPPRGI